MDNVVSQEKFDQGAINLRSSGDYDVTYDGILEFPTIEDFQQTATYISSDTSGANLYAFRNSFLISTLNKRGEEILDSFNNNLLFASRLQQDAPGHEDLIDKNFSSDDTILTLKFGVWGEFLNHDNLVIINGYLYKITKDNTIIITDGDRDKIEIAEGLEESDPENNIYIRPRSCACDPTGYEWKYDQTEYDPTRKFRVFSEQIFSNLTLWEDLPSDAVRIHPQWIIINRIQVRKKVLFGWNCHRKPFTWVRQVNFTHNIQIPDNSPNLLPDKSWSSSTGWTQNECTFQLNDAYDYPDYTTTSSGYMPAGYCLAVRLFAQGVTTSDPVINNSFYWYPFPYLDFSGYEDDPCWYFDWLYYL